MAGFCDIRKNILNTANSANHMVRHNNQTIPGRVENFIRMAQFMFSAKTFSKNIDFYHNIFDSIY